MPPAWWPCTAPPTMPGSWPAAYELQYNKMRQQTITNDILDIVGGAEALAAA